VIVYEHPLNERVRTLLRLEDLFAKWGLFHKRDEPLDHHVALLTLFEIIEVASRADLKSDLLQELERQKALLESLRNNPNISEKALDEILHNIRQAGGRLLETVGKIGQHLRENDWLMGIKQRACIPGGVSEFDLPSYHYWLHLPAEARRQQLSEWVAPLLPIRDGLDIVLRLLRDSGKTSRQLAASGSFQQMLSGKIVQLLRIRLDGEMACVPEVSANKYAINIRFVSFGETPRPRTCESDIAFDLTFCSL
jgi:cell division protein ZapD